MPDMTLASKGVAPDVKEALRRAAQALGFARVGFAAARRFDEAGAALDRWLAAGHHGEMAYLTGADRAKPTDLLANAKTLIVVALPYGRPRDLTPLRRSSTGRALTGTIAGYALGEDYHLVLRAKLTELAADCERLLGRPVAARTCVDTAPLLEREAARRAGVGFTGKSTLTIAPGIGTTFVLGELLIDVELAPDSTTDAGCGECRACLDACPTGAFVGPYVLDARRCISYLTIELRGSIPRDLRPLIGTRVFGCDVCQDVCPFNASERQRPVAPDLAPRADRDPVDLVALLELTSKGHRRFVRNTALHRVSRTRLARNAAVALGNTRDPSAVDPLCRALARHVSPLVRGHAAWALGRLGGTAAAAALERAACADRDESVRDEARAALRAISEPLPT